MRHTTRWSPDTCGCTIEYEWEDAEGVDPRIHTVTRIVFSCEHHRSLGNKTKIYKKVKDENSRKNIVFAELEKDMDLKYKEYKWNFDNDRKLHVRINRVLSLSSKKDLQDKFNRMFKQDKVVVE